MADTTSVSREQHRSAETAPALAKGVYASIQKLSRWLEEGDYKGYDTFDGLNARFVRPLTFETKFLRTALQQGVRRFPINLRPVLGVKKERSTKGMGFLARGFMRLHETTGDQNWADKAKDALQWLIDNQSGVQRFLLGEPLRLSIPQFLS